MALMEFPVADRIVGSVSARIRQATGLVVRPVGSSTDGAFRSGPYTDSGDYFVFGARDLEAGRTSGSVSYTNVVSMCRQQLHEYRHWQQRQFFRGLLLERLEITLPAMPFPDDICCRKMARQHLIATEFPAYRRANQFILSHERDAEEYALATAPEILEAVGFPKAFIEPCLVEEINRRRGWYGDRPVDSLAGAIADLHVKKAGPCLAELPLEYPREDLRIVANSFLKDDKAQKAYSETKPEDRDAFLIDYIGRRDPKVFNMYKNIKDEMPVLCAYEKMQRMLYRGMTGLPDENMYGGPDI